MQIKSLWCIQADGKTVGITVASTESVALEQAQKALIRPTASKDGEISDYMVVSVTPFVLGRAAPVFLSAPFKPGPIKIPPTWVPPAIAKPPMSFA